MNPPNIECLAHALQQHQHTQCIPTSEVWGGYTTLALSYEGKEARAFRGYKEHLNKIYQVEPIHIAKPIGVARTECCSPLPNYLSILTNQEMIQLITL